MKIYLQAPFFLHDQGREYVGQKKVSTADIAIVASLDNF